MYTFYWYPKCSTCQKAKKWLDAHNVAYQAIDLVANPPEAARFATWMTESERPLRSFFNTSGQQYRLQGLKDQVADFSVEEASERLAANGMLIKRPILSKEAHFVTNGFKESEYERLMTHE